MKPKFLILALVVALGIGGQQAGSATCAQVWKDSANWKSFTSDQLLLYADILLEKAKDPDEDVQSSLGDVLRQIAMTCSLEECHAMDEKFCNYDIPNSVDFWPAFPKTSAHHKALHQYRFKAATWRFLENKPSIKYNYDVWHRNCGQDLIAQLYFYNHMAVEYYHIDFGMLQLTLSQGVAKYVEAHGGIDAYEKNMVNPYRELSEKIHKVQNSPKLKGIAELYRDYGGGIEWIEPLWPTQEEINQLMEDYILQKIEPCIQDIRILMLYLGVDGYNEFLQRYNMHSNRYNSTGEVDHSNNTKVLPAYKYLHTGNDWVDGSEMFD